MIEDCAKSQVRKSPMYVYIICMYIYMCVGGWVGGCGSMVFGTTKERMLVIEDCAKSQVRLGCVWEMYVHPNHHPATRAPYQSLSTYTLMNTNATSGGDGAGAGREQDDRGGGQALAARRHVRCAEPHQGTCLCLVCIYIHIIRTCMCMCNTCPPSPRSTN